MEEKAHRVLSARPRKASATLSPYRFFFLPFFFFAIPKVLLRESRMCGMRFKIIERTNSRRIIIIRGCNRARPARRKAQNYQLHAPARGRTRVWSRSNGLVLRRSALPQEPRHPRMPEGTCGRDSPRGPPDHGEDVPRRPTRGRDVRGGAEACGSDPRLHEGVRHG